MTLDQSSEQKGVSHFTIVKILRSFSQEEINDFGKFLNSPFFNNHSTIVRLYQELKKYHPEFSDKSATKRHLFSIASNGKKYDDQLMRKYLSRLTKFAEEYLNIVQMRSEKDRMELNVLLQFSKRNLKDAYTRKLKSMEELYNREARIDNDYFLTRHQLSSLKHNLKSLENNIALHSEDVFDSYEYLLNYFLFQSVNIMTHLQTDAISFRSDEKVELLQLHFEKMKFSECIDEVVKLTPPEDKTKLVFLNILLNDLKLISVNSDQEVYRDLKKLVYENSERLSRSSLQYYLKRLIVFCILESSKGVYDMNEEILENYEMLIEKDLFNIDGTKDLMFLDFRQIVFSALKTGRFDWTRNFISKNLGIVRDEARKNIHNYAHAFLAFYEGRYPESLEYMSKIEFETRPLTIDIYVLKAKIFYLLGHNDSVLSLLDSFRHYIKSNKMISEYHKETLTNFLRYFRKILRYSVSLDKEPLKKLLSELQSASNTREKKWMIDIISGLLAKP